VSTFVREHCFCDSDFVNVHICIITILLVFRRAEEVDSYHVQLFISLNHSWRCVNTVLVFQAADKVVAHHVLKITRV
jgi:ABC-type iron transport system FetAB permease component